LLQFFLAALETDDERRHFEQIWQAHEPKIIGVALSMLHSRKMLDDVLQDVIVKMIHDYDNLRIRSGAALEGRIIVITKNVIRDLWKKQDRLYDLTEDLDDGSIEEQLDAIHAQNADVHHQSQVWDTVWNREVTAFLLSLPEKYRTVLEMSIISGYSNVQIAKALHIPVSTVSTRLQRALELARKTMEKEGMLP